jgi:KAP family P-loop domain
LTDVYLPGDARRVTLAELKSRGAAALTQFRSRLRAPNVAQARPPELPGDKSDPADAKSDGSPQNESATSSGPVHDRAADLSRTDAFGHMDYARAASAALIAADKTFTLGLFGDWGLGKTTIIKGIGEIVRAEGLAFVNFDVWRFEGNALRRQFLRELALQLKQQGALPHYQPERELRDLEIDVPITSDRLRFSWWSLFRAFIIAVLTGIAIWWFLQSRLPHTFFGREAAGSTAQEFGALTAIATFLYGALSQILVVEQRTLMLQRIEEPERFYQKFVELLRKVDSKRVVIAIDNLDRCSPGLVDEMLATIKTYLEPAQEQSEDESVKPWYRKWHPQRRSYQQADAVFVIAADDAAVRRHMTVREMQSSPVADGQGRSNEADDAIPEESLVEQAQRRVDEYLRKFFDASIRLRPILNEDLRTFASEELDRLFAYVNTHTDGEAETAKVPDDSKERLISLVVSALRSNPRRIKQFSNSLETRLRTIAAREESGGIPMSQEIGKDVLGVAKLAVLEEEWPDFYRALERNPRRLLEAQAATATSDLGSPRLANFLRDTRDIEPRNVAAVVNLKLEADEIELPEYGAFRDAVGLWRRSRSRTDHPRSGLREPRRVCLEAAEALQHRTQSRRDRRGAKCTRIRIETTSTGYPGRGA